MKKFFSNFFITGITWLIFNTFFFVIYFFIAAPMISKFGDGFGLSIEGMKNLTAYRVLAVAFSVLLVVASFCFFQIGKKLLCNCKNPILTFLSCFLAYAVIAVCIGNTTTNHEFTRPVLEVFSKAVLIRTQDVENAALSREDAMFLSKEGPTPLSEEDIALILFYKNELFLKEQHCYDIAKSTFLNALFALIPFAISFIGLCVRKEKRKGNDEPPEEMLQPQRTE